MSAKKVFLIIALVAILVGSVMIYFCGKAVDKASEGKLFSNTSSIPFNKVGLLLGTSKFMANGRDNPFYDYRIKAAVQLIKAGKIKYIIVSGDNSRKDYNEPEEMRDDLIRQGVDSSLIYLDYAGFRTFDSMVRLKEIFGQDSVTVISQPFHNERAIYIASREGIAAVGFNARNVTGGFMDAQVRERLARVKVFIDYWIGKKPKFLGKRVVMPA